MLGYCVYATDKQASDILSEELHTQWAQMSYQEKSVRASFFDHALLDIHITSGGAAACIADSHILP